MIPQGVQDAGVELTKQGGFAAAFVIAAIVAVALAMAVIYLFKDGKRYERETNSKIIDLTGRLGDALKDSAQATKDTGAALAAQNTTLATLAAEVRARGP